VNLPKYIIGVRLINRGKQSAKDRSIGRIYRYGPIASAASAQYELVDLVDLDFVVRRYFP
jgi:hypothetical protein